MQPEKRKITEMKTRKELLEYIASFGKKPGEYTEEETLQIGKEMRDLPRSEKNWAWLHEYLGIRDCTVGAYQMRVSRYINAEHAAAEGEVFRDSYTSSYKEKQWLTAYRRMLRDEVKADTFKDQFIEAVDKINAVHPLRSPNLPKITGKREAVLLFSDLHIGVDCSNYYNTYNADIARERLETLSSKVAQYCAANNVGTLHFLNMGDLIHGVIHTNARLEQQMDVTEQIMTAAEYVAQFLFALSMQPIRITYRSVFDNHSRAIANKNEHIEQEQFSRIIDWFVKERLKDTKIEFIEDNIDGGIGKFEIFDKTLMFAHGHQDSPERSVKTFSGLTRQWVDYICLAHYHHPSAKDEEGCKIFVNGSIVGTEQYAFGRRLFSKPSQKLLVFAEDSDDVIDIDILL